jgi:outer membrane lipoprotein LolB
VRIRLATRRGAAGALAALLLSGCAHPVRSIVPADVQLWSGRLALQVQDSQSKSFSAGFELQGGPQQGELKLYSPLGGTLAALAWAPGSATLKTGEQVRQFDSLDALASQATGTPIPIAALFDWLHGADTPVPGWRADLSQLGDGRLHATRETPLPVVDLRMALDR